MLFRQPLSCWIEWQQFSISESQIAFTEQIRVYKRTLHGSTQGYPITLLGKFSDFSIHFVVSGHTFSSLNSLILTMYVWQYFVPILPLFLRNVAHSTDPDLRPHFGVEPLEKQASLQTRGKWRPKELLLARGPFDSLFKRGVSFKELQSTDSELQASTSARLHSSKLNKQWSGYNQISTT